MQGDFREHIAMLERLDVEASEVRTAEQLDACDGLIIPGGESTTIARLLLAFELMAPVRRRIESGMPVWGTCAGAIMLANDVPDLDRPPIGAMDICVTRNAFGRQLESFEADLDVAGVDGDPFHAVFIRAPVIGSAGPAVEVLASLDDGRIVACRQGAMLATAFHPELTDDPRVHKLFVAMVRQASEGRAAEQPAQSEAST